MPLEEIMPKATTRRHRTRSWWVAALVLAIPVGLIAQAAPAAPPAGQGRAAAPGAAAPAQTGKAMAPVDLTGYWVSIVTEDWIERMSPDSPPSGTGGARGLAGLRGQAAPS